MHLGRELADAQRAAAAERRQHLEQVELVAKVVEREELTKPLRRPAADGGAADEQHARIHPSLLAPRPRERHVERRRDARNGGERARVAQEGVGVEPERGGVRRLHHRDRLRHVPEKEVAVSPEATVVLGAFREVRRRVGVGAERQDEVDEAPRLVRLVGDDAQLRRRRRRAHRVAATSSSRSPRYRLLCVPEKATKQTPNGPASGSGASCRLRNVVLIVSRPFIELGDA